MNGPQFAMKLRRRLGWMILLALLPACVISTGAPTDLPTATNMPMPTSPPPPPSDTPAQPTATELPPPTEAGDDNGDSGDDQGPEDGGGDTNVPSDSPDPPSHGDEIYATNFSRGWPDQTYDSFGTLLVTSGGYELDVVFQALWTGTTVVYRNVFYAELDATPSACVPGQSWYGMIFSWRDNDHFRVFVVTCSGRWSLFERNSNNRAANLGQGELPAGVDPSTGTHKLGVKVNDNLIRLWIDDYRLAEAGVSDMPIGDIGPYAETTGSPVTVLFSRLAIYEPAAP